MPPRLWVVLAPLRCINYNVTTKQQGTEGSLTCLLPHQSKDHTDLSGMPFARQNLKLKKIHAASQNASITQNWADWLSPWQMRKLTSGVHRLGVRSFTSLPLPTEFTRRNNCAVIRKPCKEQKRKLRSKIQRPRHTRPKHPQQEKSVFYTKTYFRTHGKNSEGANSNTTT